MTVLMVGCVVNTWHSSDSCVLCTKPYYCNYFTLDLSNGLLERLLRGHGGRVVTLSPPTSEIGVRFPALPQVGKLVVASRWSAVYSTEP